MITNYLIIIVAIIGFVSLNPKIVTAASMVSPPHTLDINGIIKKGTFFSTNFYVHNDNMKFTFANPNPFCSKNDCSYKFEDGSFRAPLIGGENDKVFSGVLKIEDKQNSGGNFTSYTNYKMSSLLHLVNTKENKDTGEEIDTYKGDIGFDTEDAIFSPQFKYASNVTHNLATGQFELKGSLKG
jgi:hypothetical protein